MDEYRELFQHPVDRFTDSLDGHQRRLWLDAEARIGDEATGREDRLIRAIARHFPAFEPAILTVGEHVRDDLDAAGTCCRPTV